MSVPKRNPNAPYKARRLGKKGMFVCKKQTRESIDQQEKSKEAQQPKWLPENLKLHDYQITGINWITYSWTQDMNVILADEMGLGKTIQTICFIKRVIEATKEPGPHLIIVPLSTCENWEREFSLWAPDVECLLYYGREEERKLLKKHCFNMHKPGFDPKATIKFDVLCTSYQIAVNEKSLLAKINWRTTTIDEAHRLKSGTSKLNDAIGEIPTDFKLLLTGTPIQNTMEELFNLLEYLDSKEFNDKAAFMSIFEEISQSECILALHDLLKTRMLRRTKKDVFKDFVGKTEQIVQASLSPGQISMYKAILTKNFKKLNVKHGAANTTGRNVCTDLRKVCNHPYLFAKYDMEAKRAENKINYDVPTCVSMSGKMTVAVQMLEKLKTKGHRVLLFTQFIKVLDLWEDVCSHYGWEYRRIDGNVSLRIRQQGIDDFNKPNSKIFLYIISTKAGGLGINLASADTVIFYDHDYNPHNDLQALARSHRIGQKNHVMIYKLVTKDSVEEKLLEKQKKKMMLAHVVVESGRSAMQNMMQDGDMDEILRFGAEKIFKDAEEGSLKSITHKIEYDDEEMDAILDREEAIKRANEEKSTEANNYTDEENNILNNYMSEFKVATFKLKTKTKEELEYEDRLMNGDLDAEGGFYGNDGNDLEFFEEGMKKHKSSIKRDSSSSVKFWNNLLAKDYEAVLKKKQKEELARLEEMGKGKRVRKKPVYLDFAVSDTSKKSGSQKSKKADKVVIESEAVTLNDDKSPTSDPIASVR